MTDADAVSLDFWTWVFFALALGFCVGLLAMALLMDRVDPQPKRRSTLWGPAKPKRAYPLPMRDAKGRFVSRRAAMLERPL